MLRRNKTPKTKKASKKVEEVEEVEKVTPIEPVEQKTVEVVNADEMAAAIKSTSGNDYQQYIRNLFKSKFDRR
jgi:hypothetical protein